MQIAAKRKGKERKSKRYFLSATTVLDSVRRKKILSLFSCKPFRHTPIKKENKKKRASFIHPILHSKRSVTPYSWSFEPQEVFPSLFSFRKAPFYFLFLFLLFFCLVHKRASSTRSVCASHSILCCKKVNA